MDEFCKKENITISSLLNQIVRSYYSQINEKTVTRTYLEPEVQMIHKNFQYIYDELAYAANNLIESMALRGSDCIKARNKLINLLKRIDLNE